MIRFTRTVLVVLALAGCNQLEKIDDSGSASGGGNDVPAAVSAAFTRSCATSAACHAGGVTPPLDGNLGGLIGSPSSTGIPLVTLGDTSASYIAVKMLPDDVLAGLGLTRMGARMPLGFDYATGSPDTLADTQTILAWIGGADFGGGDGGGSSGGDPTTGDATTGDGTTTGEPLAPTFANVNAEIFMKFCSCHQADPNLALNGNLSLKPDVAYANIFNVKSTQATGTNLVTPMDPANSYLYLKVTGEQMTVPMGGLTTMPQGGMLSDELLMLMEEWINAGAMND